MGNRVYAWFEVGPYDTEALAQSEEGRALLLAIKEYGFMDRLEQDTLGIKTLRCDDDQANYGTAAFDGSNGGGVNFVELSNGAGLWCAIGDEGDDEWSASHSVFAPDGRTWEFDETSAGTVVLSGTSFGRIAANVEAAGEAVKRYFVEGVRSLAEWIGLETQASATSAATPAEHEASRCGRVIARFTPQAWIHDVAVDVDAEGEQVWDATEAFAELSEEYRAELLDEIGRDGDALDRGDALRDDTNAPEWVRNWHSPFSIRVREGTGVGGPESTSDTLDTCPQCGGEIQATSKVYWSLRGGAWELVDADQESTEVYCENDHPLDESALDDSLAEAIIAVGLREVNDAERYARRCGRNLR